MVFVISLSFTLGLKSDEPFATFLAVPNRRASVLPLLRFIISSFSWNHLSSLLKSLLSSSVISVAVFPETYNTVSSAYFMTLEF